MCMCSSPCYTRAGSRYIRGCGLASSNYSFHFSCNDCMCLPSISIHNFGTSIEVENADTVTISRQGRLSVFAHNLNGSTFKHSFSNISNMHQEFLIASMRGVTQSRVEKLIFVHN